MSARPQRTGIKPGSTMLRQLMRELPPGYHLRPGGKAKHALYGPDGKPVRMPDSGMPLLIACSPTGRAAERAIRARLRKAGVLP